MLDRQTQQLGVIAGQDVAEVAGRHAELHLVAQRDRPALHQLHVGGEVVHDLRDQTAHVDRVRRRQAHMRVAGQTGGQVTVAEDPLDRGLRVVEVALHRAHGHVRTRLRGHLQLLHLADLALRVEHGDAGARGVGEPRQRGLAGIAGGGGHNHDLLVRVAVGGRGAGHEPGQDLQRHVLERGGRAMEQLQDPILAQRLQRGDRPVPPLRAVRGLDAFAQLGLGEIGQQRAQHRHRDVLIRLADQLSHVHAGLAQRVGDEQTAVGGDALADRLLGGQGIGGAARAMERGHVVSSANRRVAKRS